MKVKNINKPVKKKTGAKRGSDYLTVGERANDNSGLPLHVVISTKT